MPDKIITALKKDITTIKEELRDLKRCINCEIVKLCAALLKKESSKNELHDIRCTD